VTSFKSQVALRRLLCGWKLDSICLRGFFPMADFSISSFSASCIARLNSGL